MRFSLPTNIALYYKDWLAYESDNNTTRKRNDNGDDS